MKKFIFIKVAALLFMVSISFTCNAWNIDRDFNSGTLGAKAYRTPDGFDDATTGIYDNTQSTDGQALKTSIRKGSDGFGEWGGIIDFPTKLGKGEKVYFEMYIYIPAFFQIYTGNGSLKFLRFYAETANGSNGGALDIQLCESTESTEYRMIKEIQDSWFYFGSKGVFTRDKWHRVNVEFGVDDVPVSKGGTSYVKFWLDGNLLTYEDHVKTIVQPTDKVKNFLFFTYYNNGSPIDQYVWADNIKISNTRPAWWGTLSAGTVAPPNPPTVN